jgi:hypothetical protein
MSSYLNSTCPAENTIGTDQSSFWDGRWDAHEKGWIIAGATALVVSILSRFLYCTRRYIGARRFADRFPRNLVFLSQSLVISLISILKHARNYYIPKQQRQIIRILWMPAVYGGESLSFSKRKPPANRLPPSFTVVSFFSYRFFRAYTYYSVAVTAYEALVVRLLQLDSLIRERKLRK